MTSEQPRQLTFDLPYRQALAAEDFLVSHCNEVAVGYVDRWPDWPHPSALIVGPEGAGKSHLANVWRLRTGAASIAASALAEEAIGSIEASRALLVEDLDRGLADETLLFHLLNLARERRHSILLTSRRAAADLSVALPDLSSRLKAVPMVRIEPPDEGLLRAVLVKLFADRQLAIEPQIISYVALHMERSMAVAARVVARIDTLALATHRKVTRALAAEAMSTLSGEHEL